MSLIQESNVNDILLEEREATEEKAFSKEQFLKYARDFGRLYEREVAERKSLELAVRELKGEIQERKRLQEELVQSEKRYRSLFEDSQEAIYITSAEGILVDANAACLDLLGYHREEAIGSSVLGVYADSSARNLVRKLIEEDDGVRDFEFQLKRTDGTYRDCMLTASVRRGADGSVLGYQGIIRDVTEQRRSQRAMELAKRMEALAFMAGGIAHEIRNPLAISSSAAQLLMNERLARHLTKECVEKVLSGITRASLIIENLLAFAKPMTDYTLTRVDLAEVLVQTLNEVTLQAEAEKIQITPNLGCESLILKGNAELLHRAFLNLVVNGFAAMSDGGTLSISLDRNGRNAMVTVADCGNGMTEEETARVFDPFFRGLSASKGIGLGMSVAHSIVSHHGGAIQVESVLGEGSTFRVSLPLVGSD